MAKSLSPSTLRADPVDTGQDLITDARVHLGPLIIDPVTMADAETRIIRASVGGEGLSVVTVNTHHLRLAERSNARLEILMNGAFRVELV